MGCLVAIVYYATVGFALLLCALMALLYGSLFISHFILN